MTSSNRGQRYNIIFELQNKSAFISNFGKQRKAPPDQCQAMPSSCVALLCSSVLIISIEAKRDSRKTARQLSVFSSDNVLLYCLNDVFHIIIADVWISRQTHAHLEQRFRNPIHISHARLRCLTDNIIIITFLIFYILGTNKTPELLLESVNVWPQWHYPVRIKRLLHILLFHSVLAHVSQAQINSFPFRHIIVFISQTIKGSHLPM